MLGSSEESSVNASGQQSQQQQQRGYAISSDPTGSIRYKTRSVRSSSGQQAGAVRSPTSSTHASDTSSRQRQVTSSSSRRESGGRRGTPGEHHHSGARRPEYASVTHHRSGYGTSGGGHASSRQEDAPMLDFSKAMADFSEMFPGMDTEVIEAVLISNSGAVEPTIDQLVVMSSEYCDTPPPPLPARMHRESGVAEDLFTYPTADAGVDNTDGPSSGSGRLAAATRAREELELMLENARQAERMAMQQGAGGDGSVSVGANRHSAERKPSPPVEGVEPTPAPPPPLPPKDKRARHSRPPVHAEMALATTPADQGRVGTVRVSSSGLVAPLVGPLPDDFLRVSSSPLLSIRSDAGREPHRQVFSSSPSQSHHHRRTQSTRHSSHHGNSRRRQSMPEQPGNAVDDYHHHSQHQHSRRQSHKQHHYNLAELATGSPSSSSGRPSKPSSSTSSRNMADDRVRRARSDSVRRGLLPPGTSPITAAGTACTEDGVPLHLVTSTSQQQLKEDERIAMMLQNAEFVDELRHNRDFISLLQSDHNQHTVEEEPTHALMSPLSPVSPHHEETTSRKRVPIMIRNDTSPEHLGDSDNIASTTPSPVVRTPTPEHKQHEGGFRERKSSRARNLHRQATVSAERVRDYLLSGSMKESTRQVFLQLARKFQRRQRRMNLDEAVAPSNVALLDDNSDDDQQDFRGEDSRLEFLAHEDAMIRGGHGYDPGYSRVSSGGGQSHADDDDDDDLITDGTMHGAVAPEGTHRDGAYRHGNQRVLPHQMNLDTEPITFYAEEDDDLVLGYGAPSSGPANESMA